MLEMIMAYVNAVREREEGQALVEYALILSLVSVVAIAALTTILALVSPLGAFRALTRGLEVFARGVGLVLTWLLMALAYYLLFLPFGLLLRAAGKLRVTRGADAKRTSYWEPSTAPAPGIDAYRKPF
jgi:Flp pilus assembly pilin Flp